MDGRGGRGHRGGKDLANMQRPSGWRGAEEGDPSRRRVTQSARRRAQSSSVPQPEWPDQHFELEPDMVPAGSVGGGGGGGLRGQDSAGPSASGSRRRRRDVDDDVEDDDEDDDGEGGDDWYITGPMDGGPQVPTVIPSYGGHIARVIWDGGERGCVNGLIGITHRIGALRRLMGDVPNMAPELVATVQDSCLWHLQELMFPHIDVALVAAFVERWQPDTNTFHLPFGEMTIMLHDVQAILGVSVDGTLPPCPDDQGISDSLLEMFGEPKDVLRRDAAKTYRNGGIKISALRALITAEDGDVGVQIRAWYLYVLGTTLLVDKSRDRIRPHPYPSTARVEDVAWGALTLAWLYRQLGCASRAGTAMFGGCLTLLQAWIYEYFPVFRPHGVRHTDGPRASSWSVRQEPRSLERLHMCRRVLDGMTAEQVLWCPYGPTPVRTCRRTCYLGTVRAYDIIEPYQPDRVLRQIGYVQGIPGPSEPPSHASRSSHGTYALSYQDSAVDMGWTRFPRGSRYALDMSTRCASPWEVDEEYMTWFVTVSHPYLIRTDDPVQPAETDTTAPEYWQYEWPRRTWTIPTIPFGTPMPRDVHQGINDLLAAWGTQMHLEMPQPAPDPDADD